MINPVTQEPVMDTIVEVILFLEARGETFLAASVQKWLDDRIGGANPLPTVDFLSRMLVNVFGSNPLPPTALDMVCSPDYAWCVAVSRVVGPMGFVA